MPLFVAANTSTAPSTLDARPRLVASLLAASAVAGGALLSVGVHAESGALATPDQNLIETRALKALDTEEVKTQVRDTVEAFSALPPAGDPESKRALKSAVDELTFATALDAADSDPERPKIVWGFTAPRDWFGHHVPGSRWGIDNPDNVYRILPVDGASRYVITVHTHTPGPVQYSFWIYDSFVGEDGREAHLDTPVGGLRDRDIKVGTDGSFTLTVDSTPANGRANHIQTTTDARVLLIRNTFNDWRHQEPFEVSVKRLGTPTHAPLTDDEIAHRTAVLLKAATTTLVGWEKSGFAAPPAANTIATPKARGGGWGFAANGSFKIADDEALIVTLDPLGGKYLGFDLTNPWLVSLEHVHGSGSLNNLQARANPDGTFTYVIAAQDPGVYNWLSTGGVHTGKILIRWQALPDSVTSADNAVRSVKVVKLTELRVALPATTPRVTPSERRRLIDERASAYAHRYNPTAALAQSPTSTSSTTSSAQNNTKPNH